MKSGALLVILAAATLSAGWARGPFQDIGRDIFSFSPAAGASGALPQAVRLLSGSVRMTTREGTPMLEAASPSEILITLPEVLPRDFTLEFDIVPKKSGTSDDLSVEGTAALSQSSASAHVFWHSNSLRVAGGGSDFRAATPVDIRDNSPGQLTRVVITAEGETLKLYTNGRRLYTLTERRFARGRVLRVFLGGQDAPDGAVYLAGLRVLAGIATPTQTAVSAVAVTTTPSAQRMTATAPATASSAQAATAAPTAVAGITVAGDAQGVPTVSWDAVSGVTATAIMRWNVDDALCCNNVAPPSAISGTSWKDVALPRAGTFAYRVYATTSTGTVYGETRVKFANGAITSVETIAAAGSGTISSPAPAPAPPPPIVIEGAAPVTSRMAVTPLNTAPAPTISPITGTAAHADLRWSSVTGAVKFEIYRKDAGGAAVKRATVGVTQLSFADVVPNPATVYEYQVIAYQGDGRYGSSAWTTYSPTPPVNPASIAARQNGAGEVMLTWPAVLGALQYRVDGSGLPASGLLTTGAFLGVRGLPTGVALSWKVAAVYSNSLFDLATRPVTTFTIPTTPWHNTRWLTLRNGEGSHEDQLGYYTEMVPRPESCKGIFPWECLSAADMIRRFPVDQAFMNRWFETASPSGVPVIEAIFADLRDMGAGRHIFCAQKTPSPLVPVIPGTPNETLCWASTHGPKPGTEGWGDPAVTVGAAFNNWPDRGWTFLRTGAGGSLFAAFEGLEGLGGYGEAQYGKAKTESTFDVEGPKRVPHACLACHGGRYDGSSRRIVESSMIPLDPTALVFPTTGGHTRAAQEENIRRINVFVLNSNPSPAVAAYVRGLYGGTPEVAGAKARDGYVPPGWTQATELYRKIVKPYCQGCHLQQQPRIDFATYENFATFKAAIQTAVCTTKTMPHAEAPFLAMWRDGNGESLPSYLLKALGYSGC